MARFVPVVASTPLPAPGTGAEHALWDLKERLSAVEFEKAKDVAAFANHLGGTILVGATEDRSSQVLSYRPLTSKEADDSEAAIAQAVSNRCRPTPLFNFERLPHDTGKVLAINVWPSITTAIGVRIKGDRGDGYAGDAYVFPVRLGTTCAFLTSDQLPMHMLPDLRRKLILLRAIPDKEPVLFCPHDGQNRRVIVESIDEYTNTLSVRSVEGNGIVHVPFEHIASVFRASTGDEPYWRIMYRRS